MKCYIQKQLEVHIVRFSWYNNQSDTPEHSLKAHNEILAWAKNYKAEKFEDNQAAFHKTKRKLY